MEGRESAGRVSDMYRSPANRIPLGIAEYGIGDWDPKLGNHRAVVRVDTDADAVCAYLPWRRRDSHPETKGVLVVDDRTGKEIENSLVTSCNKEYGEIVFQPVSGPGTYLFYYLVPVDDENTYTWPRWAFAINRYVAPKERASADWLARHGLLPDSLRTFPILTRPDEERTLPTAWRGLPTEAAVEFQSLGEWNSFYPMEVISTVNEKLTLERRCRYRQFILFPENRLNPIRMTEDIPYSWLVRGDSELDAFEDTAHRNEYFVFQIGVYAYKDILIDLGVTFSDLTSSSGRRIPAAGCTCFNLGGVNQKGEPFSKRLHVEKKRVQALWCGVDIPEDLPTGTYRGTVTVSSEEKEQTVEVELRVDAEVLADRGDGDHRRSTASSASPSIPEGRSTAPRLARREGDASARTDGGSSRHHPGNRPLHPSA